MNLKEAVEALKSGYKIKRATWDHIYLEQDEKVIESYKQFKSSYMWDNDIILSKEWVVIDLSAQSIVKEVEFCDMVLALQQGKIARLPHWKTKYIYYDRSGKDMVLSHWERSPFNFSFDDTLANDWEIFKYDSYMENDND